MDRVWILRDIENINLVSVDIIVVNSPVHRHHRALLIEEVRHCGQSLRIHATYKWNGSLQFNRPVNLTPINVGYIMGRQASNSSVSRTHCDISQSSDW